MSSGLIAFVTCIYAYIACEQGWKGNGPGFVIWGGYAIANMGLLWTTK